MGYYPETTVSIKSWLRSRSWEGLECGSLYPTTRGPSQGGCTRWQVVNDQCQIMSGGLSRVYPCSFSILFIPFPGFCLSKGDDLAQRKWCYFLSVLPGRWQWWQELGRDGLGVVSGSGVGNPQLFIAFLLFFGWPGISRAWIFLGSLTTFLCSSLDSWHSSSNNDCQVKTTGQTAHRQCACRQFRNERGLNDLCILKSSSL